MASSLLIDSGGNWQEGEGAGFLNACLGRGGAARHFYLPVDRLEISNNHHRRFNRFATSLELHHRRPVLCLTGAKDVSSETNFAHMLVNLVLGSPLQAIPADTIHMIVVIPTHCPANKVFGVLNPHEMGLLLLLAHLDRS